MYFLKKKKTQLEFIYQANQQLLIQQVVSCLFYYYKVEMSVMVLRSKGVRVSTGPRDHNYVLKLHSFKFTIGLTNSYDKT